MILHALADYYQRLADDPNVDIAPPGFERKAIDFLVVLKADGSFESLRDIREGAGKKRKGRVSLVPKGVKRSSGIAANLLWDTAAYVFGLNPKKPERGEKQLAAFIERIEQTFDGSGDTGIQAVLRFLKSKDFDPVFSHLAWNDVEESGGNISFSLVDDSQLVCQRPDVVATILERAKPEGETQTCSISGQEDVPAELHTAIKGVWGAQSSGANIVSFNLDAFRSFGKKQGHNAPVGQQAEFAYTTALNHLLASEKQRMQVGDASTVFWAQNPCDFEEDLLDYLAPKKGEEAVSYEKIRGLLSAIKTGVNPGDAEVPFYVLGLAPNASRISIRFWYEGDVKEIKERVAQHFRDLEMVHSEKQQPYISLNRILLSTTRASPQHPYGSESEIIPNLAGDLMCSVLSGSNYPQTLLLSVVRRVKAEQANRTKDGKPAQNVTYVRAAVVKAVLNRKHGMEELSVKLDKKNMTKGYRLGRLFALLEKVQWLALDDLNANLRDKFYTAASCTPGRVFPHLMDLSNKHLKKIRSTNPGSAWNREKEIHEVMTADFFSEGFPSTLSLDDQGRFAVGYYHQKFYKPETEEGEE